ncbi:phenylalanine--tRNA ligase subunit beta [Glaciecola sp. 2405UD65-10]|uniref:phenylalanine--tRNA ligase subunit beta n=1 Tax=Glaciecola sp. 2405UD65-10 TaxID=3397244 RepID=UPI003B59B5D3
MKFSESWLREWVNPSVDTNELSEQLSMAGLEVDGIESVAGDFSGVLIGEVVECGPHPDADKLQVTKVNVGGEELLDIVCGAPNCRKGLKVAVAVVGAVLPGNFKIKKAKLRGQPSHGMLCSFSELGMGDDHSGILELPADSPIGQDIIEYLDLNDKVIEIDLTPNRADCLGIKGVAREVGVLNQSDVSNLSIADVSVESDASRAITLQNSEACPRYLGRVIENVDLSAKSPLWMQEKLRRSGIRSIDAVVDVTNYVLLELGHPMHAFDNDKLKGDITVRFAQDKESLVLLDGNKIEVNSDTLVIADAEKALALAGIFGGEESGVTAQSNNIFLESAFFSPDAILGKGRQYGLHTDASHRYERGVDPELQLQAMERASQLLLDIVGGKAGPIITAEESASLPVRNKITLRSTRLERVLGISFDTDRVTDILNRLGMQVELIAQGSTFNWVVQAPSYRFDIAIEEDLIEEVARVFGYNNIPNQAPLASLAMTSRTERKISLNNVKHLLCHRGLTEAITYSFVDPKKQALLFPEAKTLVLPHPISADMSEMRVSLLPGLLQALSYNLKRQQNNLSLFESGLVFSADESAENGVNQTSKLAGVFSGNTSNEHWAIANKSVDFFDAKAVVEEILQQSAGLNDATYESAQHTAFHPGQCAAIYVDGDLVGYLGAIHPQFEKKLGLNGRTFAFELDWSKIEQRNLPSALAISKFPAIRRDLAMTVSDQVETGKLLKSIEKIGISDLVSLNLFDVYTGDGINEGEKSLALSIWLQSVEKTLEDEEIQNTVDKVVRHLRDNFSAALRD